MRNIGKLLLIVLIVVSIFSCKKKPSAGLGGNASLKLVAKHHGLVIDSCTFYIAFNKQDAPSEGGYDLTQVATTESIGNSFALIENLKKGDYYILCRGWDPSISEEVKGGVPYKITDEILQTITVSVTEDH
jgi:hypothetical protein